jgi:hypothetical protein
VEEATKGERKMPARLGQVVYWLGVITTVVFGVVIWAYVKDGPKLNTVELVFATAVILAPAVAGWVLRYILGETK